jgi:NAD(P)-dependent dehydrogenase (short-subunit alcohol dehydrogenase family)
VANETGAEYLVADFAHLGQVRELAASLQARFPRIDVLANNAGGLFGDRARTEDGFEKTLQVNHLAPFLLTNLLIGPLTSSGASVINTASLAARLWGNIDLGDLNNDRKYSPRKAYGDSKLANILFTRELHRRFHSDGLSTAAFHPGNVASNFASDTTSWVRFAYHTPLRKLARLISVEEGAASLTWLAEGTPGVDWTSGAYYEKQQVAKTNKQASDDDLAMELWDRSNDMVGLPSAARRP